MDQNRRTAIITGALFITATVTDVVGTSLSGPILDDPAYLTRLSANANLVAAGALLEVIAAVASAGIAISLYSVLREVNVGLALGSVAFRTIEAVLYIVGVIALLSLLAVSRQYTTAAAADRGAYQAAATALLAVREQSVVPAVLAFSLGALIYYCLFYVSRLVPRWLSGFGVVAILLAILACLMALFSGRAVTTYTIILLPIAVQEMVLAVWLIWRGFSAAPVTETRAAAVVLQT